MARSPLVERIVPADQHIHYSDLQVLQSGVGWYIGTLYTDPEHGFTEPGSRTSEYFSSAAAASEALATGRWHQRLHA